MDREYGNNISVLAQTFNMYGNYSLRFKQGNAVAAIRTEGKSQLVLEKEEWVLLWDLSSVCAALN
jgi:hypothetical protein